MDTSPLYQEIVDSIRQQIVTGVLKPEDELPTVRALSEQWGCAPGTVQRAYRELAALGLVVARTGAGTRVASRSPTYEDSPLRRALLVNQAENFILNALSSGHAPGEVEAAFHTALARWQSLPETRSAAATGQRRLRFVGSHDPALSLLSAHLEDHQPELSYAGSLRGLMALARREADLAGSHLWDAESQSYNAPYVRRLLPGRRIALLRVAERQLGLIVAPHNPLGLTEIADLARDDITFINRQEGAGTRVWLDGRLWQMGIDRERVQGYDHEALTHSELASAIHEGQADVGLGIQAAAQVYGTHFVPLTMESYDLVVPGENWDAPAVQSLRDLLVDSSMRQIIADLGGYDTTHSGDVLWLDPA